MFFLMGLPLVALFLFYLGWHIQPFLEKLGIKKRWLRWLIAEGALLAVFFAAFLLKSPVLGFLVYCFFFFVLFDCITLLFRLFFPKSRARAVFARICLHGLLPVGLAAIVSIGGYINMWTSTVTRYDIAIPRLAQQGKSLTIAMVADIHMGAIVMEDRLVEIVNDINACGADMVLLGGDIFVENTTPAQVDFAIEALGRLSAPLGVYYIPGNHEYYGSTFTMEALGPRLADVGVTLLRDEVRLINDSFYLIGREESRFNTGRLPLEALMENLDATMPVIVLDHQPKDLAKGEALGVDLQLSGHTHAGQLFPLGPLTELTGINEKNYGLSTRGDYHIIVTSGIGVWGFPMRVGSPSEIVLATMS